MQRRGSKDGYAAEGGKTAMQGRGGKTAAQGKGADILEYDEAEWGLNSVPPGI